MFQEISELRLAQANGSLPTAIAAGSAPGESGVFVFSARFRGSGHVSAAPQLHHFFFHLTPSAHVYARIADQALSYKPLRGSLAICPAGAEYAADGEGSVEAIIVAIDPSQFAVAAVEGSAFEAELIERFSVYDQALFDLARGLTVECAGGYPNGPLSWNGMASTFIDGLLVRHTSKFKGLPRGRLDKQVLGRLRDYVVAHMDERIEAGSLAKIAGLSPFHFTRVFARSVGMTPYRYVVHLRLRCLQERIEAAARLSCKMGPLKDQPTVQRNPMYYQVISQCTQTLKNLEICLDKTEQYAAAKKFDAGVLLTSRLAPDMQPFIYQVQSACDYIKAAAAWLSGQTPPKHEDNERTIGEVRDRIRKTVAFAESVKEAQYAGAREHKVKLSWAPGKVIAGQDYLLQITIPNVYFHIAVAYAILRHNGVDVGKMDFLGPINLVDA